VKGIHEGTGAVVDGLARNRHVVGIHHAVDEADAEPPGDELRLARDHRVEEGPIGPVGRLRLRVMPRHYVIGKVPERVGILAGRKVLEGPHPYMAACDAYQQGPWQGALAKDRLAGRHRRKGPRRRYAQRVHRLAQDVLAQDRPEPGAPVAATREGRAAGALELDVEALARRVQDLAQKNRPAIAKLRNEAAKLVAGVGHGQRGRTLRHPVAREHGQTFGRAQRFGVEPELPGQGIVELDEPRMGDRNRRKPGEEAVRQPSIGVIECKWHLGIPVDRSCEAGDGYG
jgi:hypothetical protein